MDQIYFTKKEDGSATYTLQEQEAYYTKLGLKEDYEREISRKMGAGKTREEAKKEIQKENMERYLSQKEHDRILKKIEKYEAIGKEENDSLDQQVNAGASNRSASKRKGKIQKSAELYRQVEGMREQRLLLEGDEHTFERANLDLEMLEIRLKAMRYAAEAKGFSDDDEAFRKENAELKIRGAQVALIQKLLDENEGGVQLTEKQKSELKKKLKVYMKKYDSYERDYQESLVKAKKNETYKKNVEDFTEEEKRELISDTDPLYAGYSQMMGNHQKEFETARDRYQSKSKEREEAEQAEDQELVRKLDIAINQNVDTINQKMAEIQNAQENQPKIMEAAKLGLDARKQATAFKDTLNADSPLSAALNAYLEYKRLSILTDEDFMKALEGYTKLYEAYNTNLAVLTDAEKKTVKELLDKRESFLKQELEFSMAAGLLRYVSTGDENRYKFPKTMQAYEQHPLVKRYNATSRMRRFCGDPAKDHNAMKFIQETLSKLHPEFLQPEFDKRNIQTYTLYFLNPETYEFEVSEENKRRAAEAYYKCASGDSKQRCQATADHICEFDKAFDKVTKELIQKTGAKIKDGKMETPPITINEENVKEYQKFMRASGYLIVHAATLESVGKVNHNAGQVGDDNYNVEEMKAAMESVKKERARIAYNVAVFDCILGVSRDIFYQSNGMKPGTGLYINDDLYSQRQRYSEEQKRVIDDMTQNSYNEELLRRYQDCKEAGVEVD